ncbi:MAG: hypothetical protein J3Q66DRAFT_13387 [Benniella sp.]|nr:MAG: hypothetical protein J3Q66DRAFT_13387 [Benniella sp.]
MRALLLSDVSHPLSAVTLLDESSLCWRQCGVDKRTFRRRRRDGGVSQGVGAGEGGGMHVARIQPRTVLCSGVCKGKGKARACCSTYLHLLWSTGQGVKDKKHQKTKRVDHPSCSSPSDPKTSSPPPPLPRRQKQTVISPLAPKAEKFVPVFSCSFSLFCSVPRASLSLFFVAVPSLPFHSSSPSLRKHTPHHGVHRRDSREHPLARSANP